MNYLIEQSFLKDDSFETVLWAEKMLADFVSSQDQKLGLNSCSSAEKSIMKEMCRAFQIKYVDENWRVFLEKTPDSRAPYLTVRDLLTPAKIKASFTQFDKKFHDNSAHFPCEYVGFKAKASTEAFQKMAQKLTNREVSQQESIYSGPSRRSSLSSEGNLKEQQRTQS